MNGRPVLVIERGCRTPCCDRVPVLVGDGVYGCRRCGATFDSARAIIESVFGRCAEIRTVGNLTFVFDVETVG